MARDYYDESKPKKKKKETPKPQKVTKSPSVTKVNNKASNSTFMGGGSSVKKTEQRTSAPTRVTKPSERVQRTPARTTTPQRATDTGTRNQTTRTSRLTDAQTQKTYGTTRPNLKTAEEMRKEREEQRKQSEAKRKQMQLKKSGLAPEDQPTAAQKAATDRALKNTLPIAKESAKGVAYGHLTTLNDIASVKYQGKGKSRDEIYDPNLVEKSRQQSEERVKKYQAKTQETEDAIQKLTKNAKGLEKAYYGAVESGTGMLTDIGVGALTGTGQVGSLAAMFSRTYGSTRGKAQQEGATQAEDRAYAAAQAAKEVGTELMFPGAGLAKGYAGKQGLKLADTAANILTKNLKGKAADIGGAGVRLLGGVLEENAEEVAGWGLDPLIKELTYGKKARTRNAQQAMKERSNALRAEIQNEDDARAAAAYLSSDDFFEQTVNAYREAGLNKKDAEEVADRMRDYLTASLTGDTDSMEQIEDEVSKKVAGSKKLEWDFDELKDTIASTTLLTAATGLPGTGMTAVKGAALRDQLGDDGVRALANTAIDFEDGEMSLKAKAMKARLDSGNELTSTQVYDLQVGMQEQIRKDTQREESSRRMADKRIKSDNLITPYRQNENGGIDLDEATEASYREHVSKAKDIIDGLTSEAKESLTANEKVDGSKAIAGFQTGVFTIEDANTLNYSNTTVRAAFEEATGVDLGQYVVKNKDGSANIPATNTATKDALFAMAADNLVKSAQAETENWMDNAKGQVVTQVSARMGAQGSAVLQQALDDVDERDRSKYMMTANATDMLYQAARNMGTEWEDVASEATRMFPGISESKLKMMYEAGLADREMANDKARGRQVRMGQALTEMGEQETATGKVFIDTEVPVKGSVIRAFTEIAKNLGADIHFVDYIYDSENNPIAGANGSYDPNTNTFYLNVATGAETNIGYIFMHETTHYLKTYAPEQYQALENLVRERWFAFNPSQMQDAIARKIEAYKRATEGQQVLTEEQALEEIIADASHDFINDPEFARQVAEEDMGLAKAVLDSIRNALRMLRRIFASGSIDDDTHMNSLFRELDIMAEAEKLWLDAYKVAVQNSAINAVNTWQDDVNAQSSYSLGYHAGDLGKSTVDDYAHQGYSRGTGHFGFGTYFVGDEEQINYGNYGKRKHEAVDFDKYNLFEPRNFDQALKLHDALRLIDGFITEYSDFNQYERFTPERSERKWDNTRRINNAAEELVSDYEWNEYKWDDSTLGNKEKVDRYIAEKLDDYDRSELERKARQKYEEEQSKSIDEDEVRSELARHYNIYKDMKDFWGDPFVRESSEEEYVQKHLEDTIRIRTENKEIPYDYYYYAEAQNAIKDASEHWEWKDSKLGDLASDLQSALGYKFSERQIIAALRETERIVSDYKHNPNFSRLDAEPGLDSGATVFMKQLGYEGIDVRHISEMDNTGYGSVIYDLKDEDLARKQEIGTARFSISTEDREQLNDNGVDVTEGGSAVKYSLSSWNDTDQKKLLKKLTQAGFDKNTAQKWIDNVNSVAAIIAADRTRLDYLADRFQNALKDNDEYYKTLDLSTLCQKRRLYQGTYNAIMHHLVNVGLKPEDTVRLRQMMTQMGHEAPCGICYEESRKKNEGKFAEVWLNGADKWAGYKNMEHEDPYIPTLDEVTTTDGRAKLRDEHPEALESYLAYQRTRGSANPKVSFTHTDYRGDIARMIKPTIEKVKHIGGLRIQSFSDFEVVHVIDMMQAVLDMASKNLTAQAYTKVPAFADIFGGTGIKINLSLIGQVDENGELWFDPKEGIDPNEAFRIRDKYPENVGTILVGANVESILKAWADPRIDMVIPFHRSGWATAEFEALGLGDYEDFQNYQSERYLDGSSPDGIGLKDAKLDAIYSADYWDYSKTGKENAEAYLKLCAEKHYRPVFYNFLHDNGDGTWSLQEDGSTDGYWKSLVDFKMYDNNGKGSPQVEVQPNFDMEVAQKVMADYEGNADTLPVAQDVVDAYLKDYAKRHPEAEFDSPRYSISAKYDDDYMAAVEANDMDKAQDLVDKAAAESGMKVAHRWHGSMNANFTVFSKRKANVEGNSGAGFYFTTNEDDAINHYKDNEGADNYFKVQSFADYLMQFEEEWNGVKIDSDETAKRVATEELNKNPGVFDVYLNYKEPYVRNYNDSTNIYEMIMDDFDESVIDRNDYEDEYEYEDALWEERDTHLYEAIDDAVRFAYDYLEENYDYAELPDRSELISNIAMMASEQTVLTWDDISNAIGLGEVTLENDDRIGDEVQWGATELTRAIIEGFGYDAVQDKEVDTKFGQLSRDMMTGTEHIIVFRPEQIKLSDPVTYAEDGSVIPLSERFDPNNDDIRYSLPTEDSVGNILSDGQMEYFKNSQARDEQGRLVKVFHTTKHGGFTIFDPSYSDDHRSLFFSDSYEVSQTYGDEYTTTRFYAESFDDVEANEAAIDKMKEDVQAIVRRIKITGIGSKEIDGEVSGTGFDIYVEAEAKDENGKWHSIKEKKTIHVDPEILDDAESIDDMDVAMEELKGDAMGVVSDMLGVDIEYLWDVDELGSGWGLDMDYTPDRGIDAVDTDGSRAAIEDYGYDADAYKGYYSVYLNLVNPLIINGRGNNWNDLSNSALGIVDREWEMYSDEETGEQKISYVDNWGEAVEVSYYDAQKLLGESLLDKLETRWFENDYGSIKTKWDTISNTLGSRSKTRDIAEYAYANGYDGVILRNISDVNKRIANPFSDIYIAFSSEQVKDINNQDPTNSPDIRYSFSDEDDLYSYMASVAADSMTNEELAYYEQIAESEEKHNDYLGKMRKWSEEKISEFYESLVSNDEMPSENEKTEEGRIRMSKAREDFFNSLDAKWNDKWLSNGEVLDLKSVKPRIKQLIMTQMRGADATRQYKTEVLNRTLFDVRTAYMMAKRGRIEVADEIIWNSARNMIANLEFVEERADYETFKEIRDFVKGHRIQIDEGDFPSHDHYKEFLKSNFGRMTLVKDGTGVDQVWQALNEKYGNLFPEEVVSPLNQLEWIADYLNSYEPIRWAYSSEQAAALAFDIADELGNIVFGYGKPIESLADHYKSKYEEKAKALKARCEEAERELRKTRRENESNEAKIARLQEKNQRIEKKLADEKQKAKDKAAKKKDIKERARYTGRIQKNYDWLTKRLLQPTKDKNIPEGFRKDLARLLCMFDLQTERSKELEQKYGIPSQKTFKMWDLHSKLCNVMNEDNGGIFQTNAYIEFLSENLAKRIDGKSIDSLETPDLLAVDEYLKIIVHQFREYDKVRVGEKRIKLEDLGGKVIQESDDRVSKRGQSKEYGGLIKALDSVVNFAELTPIHFFQRMGTMYTMYKEVRKSFDKYIRNEKYLLNKIQNICGEYYTQKKNRPGSELEAWRDSRSAQELRLKNGTVTMTVAQMMSLYCLSKRNQALLHMTKDGIVITPITEGAKIEKARADIKGRKEQIHSIQLTLADIDLIKTKLTPDQMKIADKLQELMSGEMAEWGNEMSMKLYGIRMFKEKDYFPIKVSSRVTEQNLDDIDITETIKNFGFTKPTQPNARNAIEVDDIFKVVADHCNNMNLYNAYGESISDFWRVFNYKQYSDEGKPPKTVQQALEEAYGKKAIKYIKNFIKDINGNVAGKRSGGLEEALNATLGKAKKAAVFGNMRVALQQPTAIVRAFAVLNPKYIGAIRVHKGAMQEMFEHCPIAQWKSWGFYDTYMGRDIEDVMMNKWSMSDTALSGIYGQLDNITWTAIWQMCKAEVKDTHPNVKEGTQEFWDLCNERASEVFDKTQVVDSPFHRSDAMRSKDIMVKSLTSFQSEPTLTFNVVRSGFAEAADALRNGNRTECTKKVAGTVAVFVAQAAVVSATAAIWDAVRRKNPDGGDDDDKKWVEFWTMNFINNLKDNINLLNNIYLVKEIMPYIDKAFFGGYGASNNLLFQSLDTLTNGITQFQKKLEKGDAYDKSWYDVLTNLFGGFGYMFGIPVKTLMKDFKGITSWLGLDVLAADEESLMDSVAEKMGYKPIEKTTESKWFDYERNPLKVTDGSTFDNILNHFGWNLTEREKEQIAADEAAKAQAAKADEIAGKVADLTGEAKDKKVWSYVTSYMKGENGDKPLADVIQEGDYKKVQEYRDMYVAAGGNTDYFDERIFATSKSAMKKTIVYDPTDAQIEAQDNIKNYLLTHGMSDYELSEMAYKSNTAKDMKIAFMINDKDAMLETLEPLVRAGLSYEDLERIWDNRNRIDVMKYKSSKGRYADRLKSTGKFIWPTNGSITSYFGYRNAPTRGASSNHPAIDIGAPMGAEVVASDGGVVISTGWNGGYGNSVGIKHDNGMVTYYNHLSAWNVKEGDTVAQGQPIANVGSTGVSTGPHLDFKVLDANGKPVDPLKYLASRS